MREPTKYSRSYAGSEDRLIENGGPGLTKVVQSTFAETCPHTTPIIGNVYMEVWQIPEPIPERLCVRGARWCIDERQALRFSRVNIPRENDGKLPRSEAREFLAQAGRHRGIARIESCCAAQSAGRLPAKRQDANSGSAGNLPSDPVEELKHCARGSPILCRAGPERACEEGSFGIGCVRVQKRIEKPLLGARIFQCQDDSVPRAQQMTRECFDECRRLNGPMHVSNEGARCLQYRSNSRDPLTGCRPAHRRSYRGA